MLGLKLYRIRGQSMHPTLLPGDIVLLRNRKARSGDVVVVDHPRLGEITKRLAEDGYLAGDDPNSTSPAELGVYNPEALIGVAVLAITPSGIRRLSARRSANRA